MNNVVNVGVLGLGTVGSICPYFEEHYKNYLDTGYEVKGEDSRRT